MKIKKGSLSNLILLSLEKSIDGYVRLEDYLYNTNAYSYGYDRPLKKSALAEAFRRLRENGLIEKEIDEGKILYKLSIIGKDFLEFNSFKEENWDGRWRIIIFDIPESQRAVRRVLRYRLKGWGFVPWQKSVWATKQDVMNKLKLLIKELNINKWIALIESDNVQIDNTLWPDRAK